MQTHQTDFSKGNVYRNIMEVAVPMIIAQILNLLYNIVDRGDRTDWRGTVFSHHNTDHSIYLSVRKWRFSTLFHGTGKRQ